jgi:hypothetical protein
VIGFINEFGHLGLRRVDGPMRRESAGDLYEHELDRLIAGGYTEEDAVRQLERDGIGGAAATNRFPAREYRPSGEDGIIAASPQPLALAADFIRVMHAAFAATEELTVRAVRDGSERPNIRAIKAAWPRPSTP